MCIRNRFKSNLKLHQPSILLRKTKTWGFIKIQGINFRFGPKVPSKKLKVSKSKLKAPFKIKKIRQHWCKH